MDKKNSLIEKLRKFKKETSKEIPIERLILFGSRVKGNTHKYSDIDLIIVSKNFRGLKFRWRATRMYDYWNLNYPVDFLCYTPQEFNKLKKQITIVREAVKEGIEL